MKCGTTAAARRAGAVVALLGASSCGFIGEGPRQMAVWQIAPAPQAFGACAIVDAWTSESGRDGLGVTFRLEGRSAEPCTLAMTRIALHIGDREILADRLPPSPRLLASTTVRVYVAFPFDNGEAWLGGERAAELTLTAAIDGSPATTLRWRLAQ